MMVHAAVDLTDAVPAAARLGGFEAGGHTFFMSTIVKVVSE